MEYLRTTLKHREDSIIAKSIYLLERNKKRLHILIGLNVALSYLDEIVNLIRNAESIDDVKSEFLNKEWACNDNLKNYLASVFIYNVSSYKLSEEQVSAILGMNLRSLVKLERGSIANETDEIRSEIMNLNNILNDMDMRKNILIEEYNEILSKYNTPRKSGIAEFDENMSDNLDMINPTNVMVLITRNDKGAYYIKLVSMEEYRVQKRGGKGKYTATGNVENTILSNTRDKILFFMSSGKVYCKYVYQIPFGDTNSNGRALVNLLPITSDDKIVGIFSYANDEGLNKLSAVFVFENGNVRRNFMSDFINIRSNGKQYLKDLEVKMVSVLIIPNGSDVVDDVADAESCANADVKVSKFINDAEMAKLRDDAMNCFGGSKIFIATKMGMAACIPLSSFSFIRSRSSTGVKGCKLKSGDIVVSALAVDDGDNILTVTSNAFGRVSNVESYRTTGRNSVGVKNVGHNINKSGYVVACVKISSGKVVVLITKQGKAIVVDISKANADNTDKAVPVANRVGIGRILAKLNDDDSVVYAMVVDENEQ
jgi:DNA gyrase subunit A